MLPLLRLRLRCYDYDYDNSLASPLRYRNAFMDVVRSDPRAARMDVLVLVDLDMFAPGWIPDSAGAFVGTAGGGWQLDGVASTFGAAKPWDVVCGNSVYNRGLHYDTLAYRPLGGGDASNTLKSVSLRHALMHERFLGDAPVPVASCFGGLAVYKMAAFDGCRYAGGDCEHVTLHACMRGKGARLFVNPLMTVERDGSTGTVCRCA